MIADRARACLSRPPAYHSAICDRPAYLSPANSGLFFSHNDWWGCMPEPLSENIGLRVKVAVFPNWWAVFFMMYLYFLIFSADFQILSNLTSISACPTR